MSTRRLATTAAACAIVAALTSSVLALVMFLKGDGVTFASVAALVVVAALAAAGMMVFLAMYMYTDARARGMNGALAALLLFLVGPPGLVIYLLVRAPHPALPAPGGRSLSEDRTAAERGRAG